MGCQANVYHVIWKVGVVCTKMKSSLEALLEEFSKNNKAMYEDISVHSMPFRAVV